MGKHTGKHRKPARHEAARRVATRGALMTTGATGLVLLGTGAPAWAYWTATSTDANVTAKATSFGTPRATATAVVTVRVFGIPSLGYLRFGVQPPTTGPAPTKYRVSRWNGSTVCEITPPATTCNGPATLIPDILGGYKVEAVRYNWVSKVPASTSVLGTIFNNGLSVSLLPETGLAELGGPTVPGPITLGIPTSPVVITVDDSGVAGDSMTNAEPLHMSGTADPGNTVVLFSDGVEVGRGTVNDNGRYRIPVTIGEGTHAVVATALRDGVSSLASAATHLVVDRTGPALQVVTDGSGKEVELRGTLGNAAGDNAKVTVTANNDGVVTESPAVAADGTFVTTVKLKPGTTTVRVTQSDAAGNSTVRTMKLDRAEAPDTTGPKDEPKQDGPKQDGPKQEPPKQDEPTPTPTPTPQPTVEPSPTPEPTATPTPTVEPTPTPTPTETTPPQDVPASPTTSPGAKLEDEAAPVNPTPTGEPAGKDGE